MIFPAADGEAEVVPVVVPLDLELVRASDVVVVLSHASAHAHTVRFTTLTWLRGPRAEARAASFAHPAAQALMLELERWGDTGVLEEVRPAWDVPGPFTLEVGSPPDVVSLVWWQAEEPSPASSADGHQVVSELLWSTIPAHLRDHEELRTTWHDGGVSSRHQLSIGTLRLAQAAARQVW